MAGTIRSYTVAGWAISGLAAPDVMQEPQLSSWLQRYQYFTDPRLTLGTPGAGFSVRVFKADQPYEAHDFVVVVGLGSDNELIMVKDPGALVELLSTLTPVVECSLTQLSSVPAATP